MIVIRGISPEKCVEAINNISGSLQTYDHSDKLDKWLKPETKEAIDKIKYTKLENPGVGIRYVSYICNSKNEIDDGVRELATILNEYHTKYGIIGNLSRCIGLELNTGKYVLVSYPGFQEKSLKKIDRLRRASERK